MSDLDPRSATEACRRGIALFDEQRFFEAHECFERVWKADEVEEADRHFWKGVTQFAVGCCHAQRGNARGALALLERATGYLQGYPSPHGGIDTEALVLAARRIAAQIRQHGASPALDFPQLPTAPLQTEPGQRQHAETRGEQCDADEQE